MKANQLVCNLNYLNQIISNNHETRMAKLFVIFNCKHNRLKIWINKNHQANTYYDIHENVP